METPIKDIVGGVIIRHDPEDHPSPNALKLKVDSVQADIQLAASKVLDLEERVLAHRRVLLVLNIVTLIIALIALHR